jgi:hypothetical protein
VSPDPVGASQAQSDELSSSRSKVPAAGRAPSTTGPGREVGNSGKDGAQALRHVVGLVLGQLSAVAALAFYFGWARTNAFLQYFGLDASVVNFSSTDYVLRSVGPAFWPLMGLGVLVLVALAVDPRIRAGLTAIAADQRRRVLIFALLLGVVMLVVAAVGLLQLWIFPRSVPVIPLLIIGGVAVITYVAVLHGSAATDAGGLLHKAQFVALSGLIAGGVFWAWGDYASHLGTSSARTTAAELAYHPDVSVFSAQALGLSGNGIAFDPIGSTESEYHFRYTGLRLLLRSDNRYFLLPKNWRRGQDPVFVVTESHDVRLQFVAPPYP